MNLDGIKNVLFSNLKEPEDFASNGFMLTPILMLIDHEFWSLTNLQTIDLFRNSHFATLKIVFNPIGSIWLVYFPTCMLDFVW